MDNNTTSSEPWNESQLYTFSIIIRVSSVLSLMGALFIILTFSLSKSFHKPINRLAFFASFGNVLTNFATLVARDGIRVGTGSSTLCTVQAFMITWFMVTDALFVSFFSSSLSFFSLKLREKKSKFFPLPTDKY